MASLYIDIEFPRRKVDLRFFETIDCAFRDNGFTVTALHAGKPVSFSFYSGGKVGGGGNWGWMKGSGWPAAICIWDGILSVLICLNGP